MSEMPENKLTEVVKMFDNILDLIEKQRVFVEEISGRVIDMDKRLSKLEDAREGVKSKIDTLNANNCSRFLRLKNEPYPRTCKTCGIFGHCHYGLEVDGET